MRSLRIGTKSVLFGAHCFLIHPLVIALGWFIEYGLKPVEIGNVGITRRQRIGDGPFVSVTHRHRVYARLYDPRLWFAFIVHDLGYLGKPNMDGAEGETHPQLGAAIMRRIAGDVWGDFCLLHSRYYAKRLNRPVSALCMADKWAIIVEPSWMYLPRVWATGELAEYLAVAKKRAEAWNPDDHYTLAEAAYFASGDPVRWHAAVKSYMRRWIAEQRKGGPDTWTRVRDAEVAA